MRLRGRAPPQAPARVERRTRAWKRCSSSGSRPSATTATRRTLRSGRRSATASTTLRLRARARRGRRGVPARHRAAPMIPRWALGLWQSRQRYETSKASLDVVDGFRSRGIPFDNIVQDWFYWKEDTWGSHEFDPKRFPDPDKWVRDIHDPARAVDDFRVGKFYPGTKNFEGDACARFPLPTQSRRRAARLVGPPVYVLRCVQPRRGRLFWAQVDRALFRKRVDAWWLDAPEPDLLPQSTLEGQRSHMHPTALGSGARDAERLFARSQPDRLRGAARRRPGSARLHPHPFGVRRPAALRRRVWSGDITSRGRRCAPKSRPGWECPSRGSRTGRWTPVVSRCRRDSPPTTPRRKTSRSGASSTPAGSSSVPSSPAARPRREALPRDVGIGRRRQPGLSGPAEVRSAALPPAPLSLCAGGDRDAPERDHPPAAGDGLPFRRESPQRER